MHHEDDGSGWIIAPAKLESIEQGSAMGADIILISGPLEEVRHSGVVAVCKDPHILEILGEQVLRPVDRLGSGVLCISAS
jgi:hypothetical protein